MAKRYLLDYDSELQEQMAALDRAGHEAEIVIDGPAFGLVEHQVKNFFPYATPSDISRILIQIQDADIERSIDMIHTAQSFLEASLELIDVQRAYRNSMKGIITPDSAAGVGNDMDAFKGVMGKTLHMIEAMADEKKIGARDENKIRRELHKLSDKYFLVADETVPATSEGLPPQYHIQRIHDLRAACASLLMESNRTKLESLKQQIDFIAVFRKAIDEGIVPSTPSRTNLINEYAMRVKGDIFAIHENINRCRAFFEDLSQTSSYDRKKGIFVAREVRDQSIIPLAGFMP